MMGKTARKAQLDEEIAEHKKDIETLEGEQTSADETRATEHEAYATRTAKLSKAISAMEQATRQEHEMESGARSNQIKALEKSKSAKSASSAALEEELNAHTTKLQQTEDAHAADQNFLNDLTEKCEKKAQDWDQRSSTRTQEL